MGHSSGERLALDHTPTLGNPARLAGRRGIASAAVRALAHSAGTLGATLVVLFLVGLAIPPAEQFPDSLVGAFHTFFVGVVTAQEGLPADHDPDWIQQARPGDVIFVSRGHVAWGAWSHAAVVVRAPDDAVWAEPGALAVLDAAIHDGMYYSPIEVYAEWPRVALRRASDDPEVARRIADAAHAHRHRIFVSVTQGPGTPYSNCTTSVIEALAAAGLDTGLTGWRTPDELLRSPVWHR